jgi:hypothetical protein
LRGVNAEHRLQHQWRARAGDAEKVNQHVTRFQRRALI